MKISAYAVQHTVVIAMLLIVLGVFGGVALSSMNVEFMGDVSMPSVMVIAVYPGASAQDMADDVASVMEDDFVTLPDFKSVSSELSNSVCITTITFRDGVEPYDQINEVRNRVNKLAEQLPDGLLGVPEVLVGGAEMLPVVTFSMHTGGDVGSATAYVEDELRPRITAIPGVSQVSITGGSELRLNIELQLAELAARNISVLNVYQALNYANVSLPAGSAEYEGRTINVRYSGELSSIEDIENLPVGSAGTTIIRLSDVARISLGYPEETFSVSDGENDIIVVSVTKRSDGNTMQIAARVKEILAESEQETGGAVSYNIVNDDSRTIAASLQTVVSSGIGGVVMAVIVIFLFLIDLRATFIIGLSIPLSILFTFIGLRAAGISINLMSLSGMVVALGMVVDGSIVMIEEVYRYYRAKGAGGRYLYTVRESILHGADEVGAAIFASTATTVVVFIPIACLTGIVGMVLRDISITLILALSASFVSAVVIVPFLMKLFLREDRSTVDRIMIVDRIMSCVESRYRRMLDWSLSSWKFIVFLSAAILGATVFIVSALGLSFIPSTDNSDFYIDVEFPDGCTLAQTESGMKQIHALLERHVPEVQNAVYYAGMSQSFAGSDGSSVNLGYVHVVLVPVAERSRDIHDIILQMQETISGSIPDVSVKVSNGGFDKLLGYVTGGGGYGLTLVSEDMQLLYDTALSVCDFLLEDPEVITASLNTSMDDRSLVIDAVHDYMGSLGISSYEAGLTSVILLQGMDAGSFRNEADDSRYDIRLFSDITNKTITVDDISDMRIISAAGTPVSFANIADIRTEQTVSRVNHKDRANTITVSATLVSDDTSGVNARVNRYLADNPLPPGVRSEAGGVVELIGDAIPPLLLALGIAWFLVYTVMVLQFERFRQPLIIMATIPFCLIGVILGLLLFGSSMNMVSLLGVISLGGVVVNNGIILIDYVNLLRRRKMDEAQQAGTPLSVEEQLASLRECVADGSASRLRPIFMTTLTTMLGVVPMAVARGEGAEIYAPLGQAIAGGLLTSTLITLFIIPVLYYITEKRSLMRVKKRSGGGTGGASSVQKTIAATLLCVLPWSVFSQEAGDPAAASYASYTFEELCASMEEYNAELQKAQEEYARALLDVKDAKAGYQPKIDLSIGGAYMFNPLIDDIYINTKDIAGEIGDAFPPISSILDSIEDRDILMYEGTGNALYTFQFDLQQPLFTWGKITNAVKLYTLAADVRRLQYESKRAQLEAELESRLAALYYLDKITALLEQQRLYAARLVTLSQEAMRSGMLLEQDVKAAEVQAAYLQVTAAEIQQQQYEMLLALRRMTGIGTLSIESFAFEPREDVYLSIAAMPRSETQALAVDPEQDALQILDKLYETALLAEKIAKGTIYWKPDIALQVSVGFSGSMTKLFTGQSSALDDLVANVSLGIKTTVWDGGKLWNNIKRQGSAVATAGIEREDAAAALRETVNEQCGIMDLSKLKIAYQELRISSAQANRDRYQKLFDAGYGSERDVLQADIERTTAEIELYREKMNLAIAACTVQAIIN
ncbi:MAG TPA: efflux RND transporter permease subunit [Candidatus Treponema faecavium]|nr:efflux RND transporter permease subunit [Candidatus Treponema faecavium]